MRRSPKLLALLLVGFAAASQAADDIGAVLMRSQQMRLDVIELAPADSARAAKLRTSFARLRQSLPPLMAVNLRVSADVDSRSGKPAVLAETLRGYTVVASEALAGLPESERLFVLAHELGHVALNHWSQMGMLFQKWVPGDVTQQRTDAVAERLGADASQLSHQQEYEADAFALRLLRGAGLSRDEALAVFRHGSPRPETPTHPGTRRRLAALLAVDAVDSEARGAAPIAAH